MIVDGAVRRAQRPGRAPRSPLCWSAKLDDRLSRPNGGSVISSSPTLHAGPVTLLVKRRAHLRRETAHVSQGGLEVVGLEVDHQMTYSSCLVFLNPGSEFGRRAVHADLDSAVASPILASSLRSTTVRIRSEPSTCRPFVSARICLMPPSGSARQRSRARTNLISS